MPLNIVNIYFHFWCKNYNKKKDAWKEGLTFAQIFKKSVGLITALRYREREWSLIGEVMLESETSYILRRFIIVGR